MTKTLTLKLEVATESDFDMLVEIQKRSADRVGDPVAFQRSTLTSMRSWPRIGPEGLQVIRDEGKPVGFCSYVRFLDASPPHVLAVVTIDPDFRDAGIASWAYEQIVEQTRTQGAEALDTMAHSRDHEARTFLENRGFVKVVSYWTLEADTDFAPGETPRVPMGFRLRSYRKGEDAALLTDLFNATFDQHVTFVRSSMEETRSIEEGPAFDPELTFFLETDAGEAVAYARNSLHGEGGDAWIDVLGVRPDYQGRGLGRFMLLASMYSLAQKRPQSIRLTVEGTNEKARALYDSEGFMEIRTRIRYRKSPV